MNEFLSIWPALNTALIMLAMGLARAEAAASVPALSWQMARAVIAYNVVIPVMVLSVAIALDLFSSAVLAGMTLCIVSAGGTSAGAFALAAGAPAAPAARLILVLGVVSLLMVLALSLVPVGFAEVPSTAFMSLYLLVLVVAPLLAGRWCQHRFPKISERASRFIGQLASVSIVMLIGVLLAVHGVSIILGPVEPLIAGAVLVAGLIIPALFEPPGTWRRTVLLVTLVRNLALALSLAALMPGETEVLPTVLAFGLWMYLATGILLMYWRRRGRLDAQYGQASGSTAILEVKQSRKSSSRRFP